MVNGILILDEGNKSVVFDFARCIGHAPTGNLRIFVDDSNLAYDDIKSLYDSKFRVNAQELVYYADDGSFKLAEFNMTDCPFALLTFSIESFDNICKNIFIDVQIEEGSISYSLKVCVQKVTLPQFKLYGKVANAISSDTQSFMLIRTNPKLTGNVKLVVTEDYKLYLDTFKVSATSILNNQEYRHQPISDEGNYPYDIYKVFGSLPNGEMYRVYDDSYNPHKNYYDPYLQIENIYEYGAQNNTDYLYNENMKILAPLYISKSLPTFFAIFSTDRLITTENPVENDKIFKDMIRNSRCVKIFDLRNSTTIGKYLNNYVRLIKQYFSGTCSLQFIEQDNTKGSPNYRQGRNSWKGIVYNKGVFADKSETSYFSSNILNNPTQRQELYNKFLLDGYSRNNLLHPNILNLEFMFNDKDAGDLSMHNYFGLYLTENEFMNFSQVAKTYDSNGNLRLDYYNEDNNTVSDIYQTEMSTINDASYSDRIFFATTLNNAERLTSTAQINNFVLSNVANQPYENITNIKGKKLLFEPDDKSFITMMFTKQIHYGEHFKFIIEGETNVILDVIASNDESLALTYGNISPYVMTNKNERFINEIGIKDHIYRICFYTQDKNDHDIAAPLKEQIIRICSCIGKLNDYIRVGDFNDSCISVIANESNVKFQHIIVGDEDNIRYFSKENKCEVFDLDIRPDAYALEDLPFSNAFFESYGQRKCAIVDLQDITQYKASIVYEITNDLHEAIEKIACPLVYTEKGYYPMGKFKVSFISLRYNGQLSGSTRNLQEKAFNVIISPFDVDNNILLTPFDLPQNNGMINICSPMSMNISLMGINNIKDIDMYVNLSEYYQFGSDFSASFKKGDKISLNNSNIIRRYTIYTLIQGSIDIVPVTMGNKFMVSDKSVYYTDGSSFVKEVNMPTDELVFNNDSVIQLAYHYDFDNYQYTTNLPSMKEGNFYIDPTDTINSMLHIPLVPLVNCQWKSNGTYFDNNALLDTDTFNGYSVVGNFIENNNNINDSPMYVSKKLSDTVSVNGEKKTIKDLILSSNYKNIIRKCLINNNKIDTAIAYYNKYVQSLDFIYYGINFSFTLTNAKYVNEIKLNQYDNYEIFMMNDYSPNIPNEIFISNNEEMILVVNHKYKNSDSFGKDNIKTINSDISDADYAWYDMDYNYEVNNAYVSNNQLYLSKSIPSVLSDVSANAYIIEEDYNKYEGFDEDDVYFCIDLTNCNYGYDYDKFYIGQDGKFRFVINSYENPNDSIYGDMDNIYERYKEKYIDYRDKHAKIVKYGNAQHHMTYEDKINKYMDSFDNDIDLYIVNDDNFQEFNIRQGYKPVILTYKRPNIVKFNNGIFDPNFVDIFNFEIEDKISDKLNIDTLYANTCVKTIDSIKNVYYNKIMEKGKICDYNYFCKNQLSPFATDWDNDIYKLYSDDMNFNFVDGFSLGISDKIMFGSKCIAMYNDAIYLDNWNYSGNNNGAVFTKSQFMKNGRAVYNLQITLNLTDAFNAILMSNMNFMKNWDNVGNANNVNVYMNNYINNTIYKMYDFNKPVVQVFCVYDINNVNKQASSYFDKTQPADLKKYTQNNNVSTNLMQVNDKLMLTVTIQDYENMHFYPVIKINKL